MKISNKKLKETIEVLDDSTIFSVVFTKKDGTERTMVCRKGVKKHLKGGPPAYDPKDYNLVWVFDMQKAAYRSIVLDRLISAKIKGIEFVVQRKEKAVEDNNSRS